MSQYTSEFKKMIVQLFDEIEAELPQIEKAASWIADAIERDELIHAIGTGGHSNLVVEEMLWRAGGLAPMNPMLDAGTNLMMGAKRSNIVERTPGYGKSALAMYPCKEGEILIICNAYGINAMTIDVAMEAKRIGMKTIAITTDSFCKAVPAGHQARHPSNQNLYELVDIVLDSHMPYGDAPIEIEGVSQKVAGTSVLCNSFVWNLLLIEICRTLKERGVTPPVWCSGNAVGGDEQNKALEEKYYPRIKHLR